MGNGEWRLEIGEWEDLPLAVGLYSRKGDVKNFVFLD